MNRTVKTALAAFALPALLTSVGCLRNGSAAKELAEAIVAEAIVTQSVSSYNEVSASVSVNDHGVAMSCNSGGTIDWSDLEESERICYSVDSRGCDFETDAGREFTIQGESTMCGADDFTATESALYVGQTYNLAGSATVSAAEGSRTCSYDLDVTIDNIYSDGANYDVTVSGSLCGSRTYSASLNLEVEGNVSVSAE